MLIKLDIKKSKYMLDKKNLFKCLQKYGFSKKWIELIFECISTPKLVILFNGTPISQFLFILMINVLCISISQARPLGVIKVIPITSNHEPTTH